MPSTRNRVLVYLTNDELAHLDELSFACCSGKSAVLRYALKRFYDYYLSDVCVSKKRSL